MKNYDLKQSGAEVQELLNQVPENKKEIERLKQLYAGLSKTDVEIVASLPSVGVANTIYRVTGSDGYADYMFDADDLSTAVLLATYGNGIDEVPVAGSENLVKSGGVYQIQTQNYAQFYDLDLSTFTSYDGIIGNDGNIYFGTEHRHVRIPVKSGDTLKIKGSSNGRTDYAFFTEDWIRKDGVIPFASETARMSINAGKDVVFTIPETCRYLYVTKLYSSVDVFPESIMYVRDIPHLSEYVKDLENIIEKSSIKTDAKWTDYTNFSINRGVISSSADSKAVIRAIAVSKGDYIYFKIAFASKRTLQFGVFDSIEENKTSNVYSVLNDSNTYSKLIHADIDGFLCIYYHESMPFTEFVAYQYTDIDGITDKHPTINSKNFISSNYLHDYLIDVDSESYYSVNLNAYALENGTITEDGTYNGSGGFQHKIIPVKEGNHVKILSNSGGASRYAFLTSNSVTSENIPLLPDTLPVSVAQGRTELFTIPQGCKYLYLDGLRSYVDRLPQYVHFVRNSQEKNTDDLENDNLSIKNCIRENVSWSEVSNLNINRDTIISQESYIIRAIPVKNGDIIFYDISYEVVRPIACGIFSNVAAEEVASVYFIYNDKASYSGKIKSDRDGYLCYAYHDTREPIKFEVWKCGNKDGEKYLINNEIYPLLDLAQRNIERSEGQATISYREDVAAHVRVIRVNKGDIIRLNVIRDKTNPGTVQGGFFDSYDIGSVSEHYFYRSGQTNFDESYISPITGYFCYYVYTRNLLETHTYISNRIEDIHSYNSQEEYMIKSLSRRLIRPISYGDDNNKCENFVIGHITDTQGDYSYTAVQRFIDWSNNYMHNEIDWLIHTGDVQRVEWSDWHYVPFNRQRGKAKVPFYFAQGNHDASHYTGLSEMIDIYNRWFKPLVTNGWLTEGTSYAAGSIIERQTYYYVDYDKKKIRLIVLNDYDPMYDGFYTQQGHTASNYIKIRFSQEQIDMLIAALTTVPENYTVIVARHRRPTLYITDDEWTSARRTADGIIDAGANESMIDGSPIEDIINAYATKTLLSEREYAFLDELVAAEVQALHVPSLDFTNANGNFAFIMAGHSHEDMIGYDVAYPSLKYIVCGNGGLLDASPYQDVAREYGQGKGQDSFNVYIIDNVKRKVWAVKIGANFTMCGKIRQKANFDY